MTSVVGLTSLLLKHFRQKATAEEGIYLFSIHFSTALWALKTDYRHQLASGFMEPYRLGCVSAFVSV
jgi:hypothetical protein